MSHSYRLCSMKELRPSRNSEILRRRKLDCRKTETEFGEKYLVAPYSIDRHIGYIKSIKPANDNRTDATSRERTRTFRHRNHWTNSHERRLRTPPNSRDRSRTFHRPTIDTSPPLSARTDFCETKF